MPEKSRGEFFRSQEKNVYGKEKFAPEQAKEKVEQMVQDLKDHYAGLGLVEHDSVLISSGVDPSVRFIGSHISVFKPYLVDGTLPDPGYYMRQDCIRTRNSKVLFDDEYATNWGSYFPSFGAVFQPQHLVAASRSVIDLLEKQYQLDPSLVVLLVSSGDQDLLQACSEVASAKQLEIDTKPKEYYRHKIGIDGVVGRNFNIALRNASGKGFSDIGNVILLEQAGRQLGVEVALGVSVMLKQLYGLEHVLDCHPVPGLRVADQKIRRKFEDALLVSTALAREGLQPVATSNRDRIYRTYVRSLSYFRVKAQLSLDQLERLLVTFEENEFPGTPASGYVSIMEYLRTYEEELKNRKNLSPEDTIIFEALTGHSYEQK